MVTPPIPRLLKTTTRKPELLAAYTRHLTYSSCESLVNPGKIIMQGEFEMQFVSNQSKATSPPSFRVKISLKEYRVVIER